MSLQIHFQKHFNLEENQTKELLKEIYAFIEKTPIISNKQIVVLIKKTLNIKQQFIYEKLSQISGYKNYNIAKSKSVEFKYLFILQNKISTGFALLDDDLKGGLPRGAITSFVAPVNMGKTMFCISIGANFIRSLSKAKVLHISLEDVYDSCLIRYISNLTNIEFTKILSKNINEEEMSKIKNVSCSLEKNLMIKTFGFNITIEELISEMNKIYEEFKFDLIIIDYPQIMNLNGENIYDSLNLVYQKLEAYAIYRNCAILTPIQCVRKSNEYFLNNSKIIFKFIEKSNVNKTMTVQMISDNNKINEYVLKTKFECNNLIT